MAKISTKPISTLRFDPKNARRHSQRNLDTIEKSLREVGAGRSLVAAADGTILAGNATLEAAGQAGFEDALIVETDGTQLVVIKRTDLQSGDDLSTKLALYDNRAAEFADWMPERIQELQFESPDLLASMFTEQEVTAILRQIDADATTEQLAEEAESANAEDFVQFKFGDYTGRVAKAAYEKFITVYEATKAEHGYVMMDDVIQNLMGFDA